MEASAGSGERAERETRGSPGIFTRTICRALDIAISMVGLVVSSPLLLLAAFAVRLDTDGPAVLRQRRVGLRKQPFTVYKLRTMDAAANPGVHRRYVRELIRGEDTRSRGQRGGLYKLTADDRVTRVGRILRRTSIDELPQLCNVLRGEMSIVGPRPVIPYETEAYPPDYDRRFEVKPGLTGIWQVSGRNQLTYHEMVMLDIAWAERVSIGLYLAIVARTPWALVRSRSAA